MRAQESALTSREHVAAAERHARVAVNLRPRDSEWAAVAYFYAGYHLVRRAMLDDPVWHCPAALAAKHPDLRPDHAKVTRHHGRLPGRRRGLTWGVNDLVKVLYPSIARAYIDMHKASIEVRYLRGLRTPLRECADNWTDIRTEYEAGRLRAA
jgi:hypothetical protein